MGAVTLALVSNNVLNSKRTVVADVTFNASYVTGGDTFQPTWLGLSEISAAHVLAGDLAVTESGFASFTPNVHGLQVVLAGTTTAPKLKAYEGSTSEVTATTNLGALGKVRIEFYGV